MTAENPNEDGYAIFELRGRELIVARWCQVNGQMMALWVLFRDQPLPVTIVPLASIFRITPCTREQAIEHQAATLNHIPQVVRMVMPADILDQAAKDQEAVFAAAIGKREPF